MQRIAVDDVISMFFNVGRQLRRQMDSGGFSPDLTMTHLEALRYIGEHKPASMKQLASFLAITPPSATVLTDHLTKLKLVKRQPDPKSRRNIDLVLTNKGAETLQKLIKIRCQRLKVMLNHLNKQEQLTMFRLLKKMGQ